MARDAKGANLTIGDRVLIPATVTGVAPTDDYVNCTLDLQHAQPPDKTVTQIQINTAQVERTGEADKPQRMAAGKGKGE